MRKLRLPLLLGLAATLATTLGLIAQAGAATRACAEIFGAEAAQPAHDDVTRRYNEMMEFLKSGGVLLEDAPPQRPPQAVKSRASDLQSQDFTERADDLLAYLKAGGKLAEDAPPVAAQPAQSSPPKLQSYTLEIELRSQGLSGLFGRLTGAPTTKKILVVGRQVFGAQLTDLKERVSRALARDPSISKMVIPEPSLLFINRHVLISSDSFKHRWSENDRLAIELSQLTTHPREVMIISARNSNGVELARRSTSGTSYSIAEESVIHVFNDLWSQLRSNGSASQVKFFEMTHSHPATEVYFFDDVNGEMNFNRSSVFPLSEPDKELIQPFALSLPTGVLLKFSAAHPGGYTSSQYFMNGRYASKEVASKFESFMGVYHIDQP